MKPAPKKRRDHAVITELPELGLWCISWCCAVLPGGNAWETRNTAQAATARVAEVLEAQR